MTAERLLKLFDRVADAPDAVPRLRGFVLDLAVHGRLTRVASKSSPQARRRASESGTAAPFELPDDWKWTTIGAVCSKTGSGSTPRGGREVYKLSGVPFLRSQNIQDTGPTQEGVAFIEHAVHERTAGTTVRPGDLLLNITGGSIGRCAVVPAGFPESNVSQHVAILRPEDRSVGPFLHIAIRSPYFQELIIGAQTGAGRGGLPKNRMDALSVPLPPGDEQLCIVARVDELMALCDRLDAAQKEREAARRSVRELLTRSIGRGPSPASTVSLSRLASVVRRPEDVPGLRGSILRLAVQGRLHSGSSRASTIAAEDSPFSLPEGWKWSALSTLGRFKGGATPSKANPDYWIGAIPWVSPRDMKVDYVGDARLHITQEAIAGSAVSLIEPRSLLFVVRGMILGHSFPVAVTQVLVTINQDMKALVLTDPSIADYLLVALKALKPEMLARVKRSTHGTGRIEGPDYRGFPVPLPPAAVRQRIVAKVAELMTLCDQLEAHLKAGDIARSRLLDALIAETLAEPHVQSA